MQARKLTVPFAVAALSLGAAGLISGCTQNGMAQSDNSTYDQAGTAGSSTGPGNRNYGNDTGVPSNAGTGTSTDVSTGKDGNKSR